jgi:HlyD family secretion protein
MKKLLVIILIIMIPGTAGYLLWHKASGKTATYKMAAVARGDLLVTIGATGTLEPEELVDVGAQVAGKIESFGVDPHDESRFVDYGSVVEKGTILARIDDSMYAAEVEQNEAQVEQAKANVNRAKADLKQAEAKLINAENNWRRAQELGSSKALAATTYDSYKAEYETAKATVEVSKATILQAEKSVIQAEATLKRARTNLGYCTIQSPVKGVIIDRRVNIGQTVVASLSAPSLFLIAKDLTKMQVWASVNEADIGNIHPGQSVTFTVDAFPGIEFKGVVRKIRYNATMTQNVVTYVVEISTDNSDGKLLPYLTANVRFEVLTHKDVLLVPNAALRWEPTSEEAIVPEMREKAKGLGKGGQSQVVSDGWREGTVWVREGEYVKPIAVRAGNTDGRMTEIESDVLKEGDLIIVGELIASEASEDLRNPFTPNFRRH